MAGRLMRRGLPILTMIRSQAIIHICVFFAAGVLLIGYCGGCSKKPGINDKGKQSDSHLGGAVTSQAFSDLWNKTFTFESVKGRKKIAFVFSVWCPHCDKEATVISTMLKEFGARGIEFIGVSLNSAPRTKDFIRRHFLCCTILLTSKSRATNDFGIKSIPAILLIDENNTIVKIIEGEISQSNLATELQKFAP
jgi:peroxiredoxin